MLVLSELTLDTHLDTKVINVNMGSFPGVSLNYKQVMELRDWLDNQSRWLMTEADEWKY